MIDKIDAPDASTMVFHLKFPTTAFLPALADPMSWIYEKAKLDNDPHWYEKNIDGPGSFKFAGYEAGQWIKGVRNPDYYRPGVPYLDGFTGMYGDKQAVRVNALRADRAGQALGDQIMVAETPNHARKPLDDVRMRRALTLALDRWHGAPGLAKIAIMRTVGGALFPGSPTQSSIGPLRHATIKRWTNVCSTASRPLAKPESRGSRHTHSPSVFAVEIQSGEVPARSLSDTQQPQ